MRRVTFSPGIRNVVAPRIPRLSALEISIYRQLRETANNMQKFPGFRAVLDPKSTEFSGELLKRLNGGPHGYLPEKPVHVETQDWAPVASPDLPKALRDAVRIAGSSRLVETLDIVRELKEKFAVYEQMIDLEKPYRGQKWRSLRTNWNQPLEQGLFLVSGPQREGDLDRRILLITKHEPSKCHTQGLVLNVDASDAFHEVAALVRTGEPGNFKSPVADSLYRGSLTKERDLSRLTALASEKHSKFLFGGPVPSAWILHGDEEAGLQKVSEGLWLGVKEDVGSLSKTAKRIVGSFDWSPGVLASKIAEGLWIPVKAEDPAEAVAIALGPSGHNAWKKVLCSLSPEYAEISRLPRYAMEEMSIFGADDLEDDEEEDWDDLLAFDPEKQ